MLTISYYLNKPMETFLGKEKNKIEKLSYRLGTFQVLSTFEVDMPDIGYGLLYQQDKLFVLHNGN